MVRPMDTVFSQGYFIRTTDAGGGGTEAAIAAAAGAGAGGTIFVTVTTFVTVTVTKLVTVTKFVCAEADPLIAVNIPAVTRILFNIFILASYCHLSKLRMKTESPFRFKR